MGKNKISGFKSFPGESVPRMICLRVVISKTYVDHGIFKVPQNMQFIFEMLNLVVMFATFVLNISMCIITPMEQAIPSEYWLQDNSGIPGAILGINIAQAVMLVLIILNSIFHWTKGAGAAQRTSKGEAVLPEDPVTITVIRKNAIYTFRYWQLFLQQILATLQAGLALIIKINRYDLDYQVTFIICYLVMCLTILSLVLTYLYSTDTFFMVCFLLVTLCVHRQYPHQVTVSEASLRRNNLEYVSAATRADPEGFIPPSRDWTRSPATSTSPPAPLSSSPSLPLPQIVRDSSSRLAIGFPKCRNEGDTEPIVDNVDNAET